MEDFTDNLKNLYVIRHKLADLKKAPSQNHFEYYIDRKFKVAIWTDRIQEHSSPEDDNIVRHPVVDVVLYEVCKKNTRLYDCVYLNQDPRFKDYKPIKYTEFPYMSNGDKMPINHLCELIIYLHRISKLSAFM